MTFTQLDKVLDLLDHEPKPRLPYWHNLRKNPNDLPKRKGNVVLNQDGDKVTYDYFEGRWRWLDGTADGLEMIAWCEVPKLKEE